jgi:ATP-dependent Lhr-like helicase
VPNEFWPHHGSLSKELREEGERRMNDKSKPATLVATTTLELGIDVGSIESVAQIGTPPSVAALKQRLGRSGRQGGAPAILRILVQEPEITPQSPPQDTLHLELVQAIAMVELLIEGWVEPPPRDALHLSTLVQQVLSVLAQHGGADARTLWRSLCSSGPFKGVDQQLFADLLRSLAEHDLIIQDHSGTLALGVEGEHLVDHYEFYAAFTSPEEYRLVAGAKTIGRLPIANPLFPGALLIFAGRRWRVVEVVERQKVIELTPTAGGRPPAFLGSGGPLVHDRVRQKMFELYCSAETPRYLDPLGADLLEESRSWFRRLQLDQRALVPDGDSTLLFSWFGDHALATVALLLSEAGLEAAKHGPCLEFEDTTPDGVEAVIRQLASRPLPDSLSLALKSCTKASEKFHPYLDEPQLAHDYASSHIDLVGAREALTRAIDPTEA